MTNTETGLLKHVRALVGFVVAGLCWAAAAPTRGQVLINEFMAVNDGAYTNRQGLTPDWIELCNTSSVPVNLAGWRLTDNADNLAKWIFPATNIAPSGFLLVMADGSATPVILNELHANFKLSDGGEYLGLIRPDGSVASEFRPKYPAQSADVSFGLRPGVAESALVSSNAPVRYFAPANGDLGTTWTARTGFDGSAWAEGPQPLGFETSPSNFAAHIQTVLPTITDGLYVRMPFVVSDPARVDELVLRLRYDDGVVIYLNGVRVDEDNAPAEAPWNAVALEPRVPEEALEPSEFYLTGSRGLLVGGTNVLAIHVVNEYYNPRVFRDLLFGAELTASSYSPGSSGDWRYFSLPSPGRRNVLGEADAQPPVVFSPERGFYEEPIQVRLTCPTVGATIRYTLNGTAPTLTNGLDYTGPLAIASNAVVRARVFKVNFEPSAVQTHSYVFLDEVIGSSVMSTAVTAHAVYGPLVRAALTNLPSVMIALPGGVPTTAAEQAASVEYLLPDGSTGFSINGGVRRVGGASVQFVKGSIRLYFRDRYGAGKLRYPLFKGHPYGLDPVQEFDQITLRSSHDTVFYRQASAQYVRNIWIDDMQLIMGHVGLHGRQAHVYLNGVYHGLYQIRERPTEAHHAAYRGGAETNYTYKSETAPSPTWTTVLNLRSAGNVPEIRRYVDEYNLMDYMVLNFYGGNWDWGGYGSGSHNWIAAGPAHRDTGGMQFYSWDSDMIFNGGTDALFSNTGVPDWVFDTMMTNADSRMRFADRVYRHCFHDGILTPTNAWTVYDYRAQQVRLPIVAEAARWDGRLVTADWWETEYNRLRTSFFPQRTAWVVQQLRGLGWYPALDAPEFSQNGGPFAPGFRLTMMATNAIYYTLDGRDPREWGTGREVGDLYGGAIILSGATRVKARARDAAGSWSALHEALFVPAAPAELRVSEVMFHPRHPPAGVTNWTSQDYEFVEVQNVGRAPSGLAGVRFTRGMDFDFGSGAVIELAPGEHVVVVANLAAFQSRHPNWASMRIAGEYQRRFEFPAKALSDGGEEVRLEDGLGRALADFTYADARGWPEAADGAGHSLVPLVWDNQTATLDYGGNWRASAYVDGSPGAPDPEPAREAVLNEVVAHTDLSDTNYPGYDSNDWLELFNPGTTAVSFVGWYLSDDADDLSKWAIPAPNTLAPGAWVVFDEVSGFHHPLTNGFGLNKAGETVFLSYLPGGGLDRVVDAVRFKGQENGASLGRYRDGAPYWYALAPTPWAANVAPTSGVRIGEFLYHPATTGDESLVEFVEVHNAGSATAQLWNADGAWRLDGGVGYTFPAGVALAPQERLVVVGFDPVSNAPARASFLATYGLSEGQVRLYGPYDGQLDNHGERLALEKPLAPDLPEDPLVWVIVDEVIYFDRAPWTAAADGTGNSLARADPLVAGRDPANWYAAWPPTPGVSAGRVVLAAPEDGAVVFAQNDEPLWAVADGGPVTFCLNDAPAGTDEAAPYTGVARLPAAGRYALRAELTDAAGVWTSRTAWVTALALSNAVVTAVDDLAATVQGGLAGASPAAVWVHWGLSDGGTNVAAWASSAALGTVSNAAFQALLDGLSPGRPYAVRFSAVAGERRGWSPATTVFTTKSYTEWPHHTTIRFDGYTDAETLVDFPALVRLGTNIAGFAYSPFGGTWASLRFTDEADGRALPYEVDAWDTNGESAVWVRVPALTNGAAITAYWGLPGATNPPATSAPGAVWRADDEAVWHWQDGWRDATWRGREAANGGSTAAPGVVGSGRTFDGVSNAIALPLPASWYGANLSALTASLWVKPAVPPREYGTVWGCSNLYMQMHTSARVLKWAALAGGAEWQGPAYETGAWQLVSLVLSNGTAFLQKNDGAAVPLGAYTAFTPANAPVLGRRAEGDRPFEGTIDEVRLSRTARSAAWLRASYRTVAQPATFTSFGPVITATGDADGDGLPDVWERLHFADTARDGTGDWDGDGQSDEAEFAAGTDPTNAASNFRLSIAGATNGVVLGFQAILGEPGSEGQVRFYTLESATGLTGNAWWGLPGYTNLQGLQGDVRVTNPATPGAGFYRGRVRLEPAP